MTGRPARRGAVGTESLLFIVGHPLSHTLSPAMHGAVIARRRLPLRYVPVEIRRERLPDFLAVVRDANIIGGNVTIPFKEDAARLADERSEAVTFCGAANTICVRGGRLRAENTDGDGFLDALRMAGWDLPGGRVVILGAGGSARGIAYALCREGIRDLVLLNRHPERADDVAAALVERFPRLSAVTGRMTPAEMRMVFENADLVVQCTSLGLTGEWKNFPTESLKKSARFVDIVYRRGGTPLVRALRRRVAALDGLPMLACQAARSFALWTGISVPPAEFLEAARKRLSGGS